MADNAELDRLKEMLRVFAEETENLWIENVVYFDLILSKNVNPSSDAVKKLVADAQADPEKRRQARKQFAALWEAIEKAGNSSVFADILSRLPQTDIPN